MNKEIQKQVKKAKEEKMIKFKNLFNLLVVIVALFFVIPVLYIFISIIIPGIFELWKIMFGISTFY